MASNGCFIAVLIARTHDHMALCSYTDPNYVNSQQIQKQQTRILTRMKSPAAAEDPTKSVGSYYQSFDDKDCVYFAFQDAATDLTIITTLNKLLLRNSGDVAASNRLACALLDNVFAEFMERYSASEIGSKALRPYNFIKFDMQLQQTIQHVVQQDHMDGGGALVAGGTGGTGRRQVAKSTTEHYDSLKREIIDARRVVRQNLDDLLVRGEKLETINAYGNKLKEHSGNFEKRTRRMNRMRLLQLYGPPLVVIVIILTFFYFYFF